MKWPLDLVKYAWWVLFGGRKQVGKWKREEKPSLWLLHFRLWPTPDSHLYCEMWALFPVSATACSALQWGNCTEYGLWFSVSPDRQHAACNTCGALNSWWSEEKLLLIITSLFLISLHWDTQSCFYTSLPFPLELFKPLNFGLINELFQCVILQKCKICFLFVLMALLWFRWAEFHTFQIKSTTINWSGLNTFWRHCTLTERDRLNGLNKAILVTLKTAHSQL